MSIRDALNAVIAKPPRGWVDVRWVDGTDLLYFARKDSPGETRMLVYFDDAASSEAVVDLLDALGRGCTDDPFHWLVDLRSGQWFECQIGSDNMELTGCGNTRLEAIIYAYAMQVEHDRLHASGSEAPHE